MQTIKIDLTVKPPRHSYKCLIVGRKFDLFHCCIGSAAWSGWKGRKVPRSQCSEWIRLGYSGHDCLWLKHIKRKKSWLSISDGYRKSLCVLLYVCICVYMCMGCDVNPCCWITSLCEIWQLPLLSLWQDKRAPVCVRDSDSEKEEEVATKKARNQSLFTQKINMFTQVNVSLKAYLFEHEQLDVPHFFETHNKRLQARWYLLSC